jgi:DNA integrity scanning protein DisA with diadenylate cyclase activity
MLQGDTFKNLAELVPLLKSEKVVVVTENPALQLPSSWQMINVRAFSKSRFSQVRSAIMIGITRGIIGVKDRICCLGGVLGSNLVDSIIVFDIEKEFSNIFMGQKNLLPEGVKPEVIERVIDIATELSVEGREGKPVGCIFVIGNIDEIKPHIKQLILNPFFGYKPEDRNILNPFMDETVKEYSLIDGAFIIDGNGILDSAGSLIHTPDFKLQLPGGLGARHAAAYSISLMADCISLVVSSSTGQITLFRKGQMLLISERKRG